MRFLKTFESSTKLEFTQGNSIDDRIYYFSTKAYDYRVIVYANRDGNPPSFGFKAKRSGSSDFNYDQSIVTNDNLYQIMKTILDVIEFDRKKYKVKSYTISSYSNKKGLQRMQFYKRVLSRSGWIVEPTEYPTYFTISKKK